MSSKNFADPDYGLRELTKVGRCPVCKAHIERPREDKYFPYCTYNCKRKVESKEEALEKSRIWREQRRYEESLKRQIIRDILSKKDLEELEWIEKQLKEMPPFEREG